MAVMIPTSFAKTDFRAGTRRRSDAGAEHRHPRGGCVVERVEYAAELGLQTTQREEGGARSEHERVGMPASSLDP